MLLSTGVMINMHYCGGELESVSLSPELANCCCESTTGESECCNNEQLVIQFDNDEQVVSSSIKLTELFNYIDTEILILNDLSFDELTVEFEISENESPPPKLAIWKSNCSILFYG